MIISIFVDGTPVSLYRWTDPVLGPRTMPDLKTPLAGLTQVMEKETFSINLEKNMVNLGDLTLEEGLIFRADQEAASA